MAEARAPDGISRNAKPGGVARATTGATHAHATSARHATPGALESPGRDLLPSRLRIRRTRLSVLRAPRARPRWSAAGPRVHPNPAGAPGVRNRAGVSPAH